MDDSAGNRALSETATTRRRCVCDMKKIGITAVAKSPRSKFGIGAHIGTHSSTISFCKFGQTVVDSSQFSRKRVYCDLKYGETDHWSFFSFR